MANSRTLAPSQSETQQHIIHESIEQISSVEYKRPCLGISCSPRGFHSPWSRGGWIVTYIHCLHF